jgi:hypothetical protein
MEKISWTDRVRNEEVGVLHRVCVERNILRAIKRKKANCTCHILLRNCFSNKPLKERHEELLK